MSHIFEINWPVLLPHYVLPGTRQGLAETTWSSFGSLATRYVISVVTCLSAKEEVYREVGLSLKSRDLLFDQFCRSVTTIFVFFFSLSILMTWSQEYLKILGRCTDVKRQLCSKLSKAPNAFSCLASLEAMNSSPFDGI